MLEQVAVDVYHGHRRFSVIGISSDDYIVRKMVETRAFYEIDLLSYIESIASDLPPGVVVDVGANIGNHAIFLGAFVRAPVIAFEANPDVVPLLRRNLVEAGVEHTVVGKALAATPSRGTIVVPDRRNIGSAVVVAGSGDIEVSTFDDLYPDIQVAVMKVDVEGMELSVLRGATDMLARCRPHLFLEAATRRHFIELAAFLRKWGYRPVVRWAYTPVWHFAPEPRQSTVWWARWRRLRYQLAHRSVRYPRY